MSAHRKHARDRLLPVPLRTLSLDDLIYKASSSLTSYAWLKVAIAWAWTCIAREFLQCRSTDEADLWRIFSRYRTRISNDLQVHAKRVPSLRRPAICAAGHDGSGSPSSRDRRHLSRRVHRGAVERGLCHLPRRRLWLLPLVPRIRWSRTDDVWRNLCDVKHRQFRPPSLRPPRTDIWTSPRSSP